MPQLSHPSSESILKRVFCACPRDPSRDQVPVVHNGNVRGD